MTGQEATEVLAVLMSAWPNREWPLPTQKLWLNELANLKSQNAEKAAVALMRESEFAPSIAQFLARYADFTRHEALRAEPTSGELQSGETVTDTEQGKANIAKLRQMLAEKPVKRPEDVAS